MESPINIVSDHQGFYFVWLEFEHLTALCDLWELFTLQASTHALASLVEFYSTHA